MSYMRDSTGRRLDTFEVLGLDDADHRFDGVFKPANTYTKGDLIVAPSGAVMQAVADFTSGSTYSAGDWTGALDPAVIPVRTADGRHSFTTQSKLVAQALGYVIVTDTRYAGGAKGDGVTDDTAALAAAYAAAGAKTYGGTAWHPPGKYLNTGNLPHYSNVTLAGAGPGSSILRLASGSNTDVIVSVGFGTCVGTNQPTGIMRARLVGLEIDGNAAGQTILPTTVTSASNNLPLPQSTINVVSTANWPVQSGSTTVTSGSNGVNVNTFTGSGVLNVASTASLPSSGVVTVVASGGTAVVSYTGKTATTLTGCTTWDKVIGVGTIATGAAVTVGQIAYVTGSVGEQVIVYTGKTSTTLTGCAGGAGTPALNTGNMVYVAGRAAAIYGSYLVGDNCWFHDCTGSGFHTEWGTGNATPTGSMESHFTRMKFSMNGVTGWQFVGPHDSHAADCVSWDNGWAGFAVRGSFYMNKCHAWGAPQLYGFDLAGGDVRCVDCYAEVAVAAGYGVRILGVNAKWINGWINGVSGGQGMLITGTPRDYVVTGIFSACNTWSIKYGGSDGGNGYIDIVAQQSYGPIIASHFGTRGVAIPSTPTFVDGTVVRTDVSAAGSAASSTITDTAIVQADRGKSVFGTNTPAGAVVGAVTTGVSFTLQDSFGNSVNPTGAVSGITLVPTGSDLVDVAATTRIKAVAVPPAGASATAVLSVDTGEAGLRKSGNITPSTTVDTYGTGIALAPATPNAGMDPRHVAFGITGIGSETLTCRATAVYSDGTTAVVTKTSTTNQTIAFANSDLYSLTGAGKVLMTIALDVKSSIGSSPATVAAFIAA